MKKNLWHSIFVIKFIKKMMLIISLVLGTLTWTLLEYVLHRFLGHVHKGKNFFKSEHTLHHAKLNYFAPFYKKAIAAVIVAAFLIIILNFFTELIYAGSFTFGLIGMYIVYEHTHYRYHTSTPLIPPFIILRKHHFYHHFHNPKMNHGVTTRIWDRVFGTFVRVDIVKIPKQMTMDWLIEKGELKPAYLMHFMINKR